MVPEAFAVAVRNVADHSFHDVHLRAIVFSAVQKFLLEQDQGKALNDQVFFRKFHRIAYFSMNHVNQSSNKQTNNDFSNLLNKSV